MNNRTIAKAFFISAFALAVIMAVFDLAASFSQNALGEFNGFLNGYLGCGAVGFAFLTADTKNRNKLTQVLMFKVQWGYIYLWMTVAFLLTLTLDVYNTYYLHLVSTAMIVVGAYALAFYFKGRTRDYAISLISACTLYFGATFLFKIHTIAWGEMVLTLGALFVTWVIINEKLNK